MCNYLQLEDNPAGCSGFSVLWIVLGSWSSSCNFVKNVQTFDLCYWKWNQQESPHISVLGTCNEPFSEMPGRTNNAESQRNLMSGPLISTDFQGKLAFACFFSFLCLARDHMRMCFCRHEIFAVVSLEREQSISIWQDNCSYLSVTEYINFSPEHWWTQGKNHQSPLIPSVKYTQKMNKS